MKGQTLTELRAEDDCSVSVRVHASHKNSTHILTLVSLSVQLYAANDGWHFLSLMKVFEATRRIVNQGEKVMNECNECLLKQRLSLLSHNADDLLKVYYCHLKIPVVVDYN